MGVNSQVLEAVLNPFQCILDAFQWTNDVKYDNCDIGTVETSEIATLWYLNCYAL